MPRRRHGHLANTRPLRRTYFKECRELAGLTQAQAAEMIGVDQSMISKMESGRHPYAQPLLESAAEAYGCDIGDLLFGPGADRVAALLRQATPAQRDMIADIAKTIIDRK